jgi:hypothetical protein
MRTVIYSLAMILGMTMPIYAAPYAGRTTQVGRQSFYYGASGRYEGRASSVGRNTYYYGSYPRPGQSGKTR